MSYIGVFLLANRFNDEFIKYKNSGILDESWLDLFKMIKNKDIPIKSVYSGIMDNAKMLYLTKVPKTIEDFSKYLYTRFDKHNFSDLTSMIIDHGLEYLLKMPDNIIIDRYTALQKKSIASGGLTGKECVEYNNISHYITLLSFNKEQFKNRHPILYKAYLFIKKHPNKWSSIIDDVFRLTMF